MSEENRGRVPTGPLPRLFMACDVSHIPVSPPPRTQRSGPRRNAKKSPPERSFRRSRKRNGGGISGNGKRDTGLSQHPPSPRRREPSEAVRGGMRRNPRQSAVFGEAGNGTAAGISELVRAWGLEPQRIAAREPKSRMSANFIMPADIDGGPSGRPFDVLNASTFTRQGDRERPALQPALIKSTAQPLQPGGVSRKSPALPKLSIPQQLHLNNRKFRGTIEGILR